METTDGEQLAFFEPPPVPVPAFGEDPALDAVQAELERCDPTGDGVAGVLRDTLDQLYDGQHTGRYSYDDLRKTGSSSATGTSPTTGSRATRWTASTR